MLKAAFFVLAMLSLSACATVTPTEFLDVRAPAHANAAAPSESDLAPTESITTTECVAEPPPPAMAASASPALSRRAFGYPSRNQPDLRLVQATASDRARSHRGRRRAKRAGRQSSRHY